MRLRCAYRPAGWLVAGIAVVLLLLVAVPLYSAAPRHATRGVTQRAAAGSTREVLEIDQNVDIAAPQVSAEIVVQPSVDRLPDEPAGTQDTALFAESLPTRAPPAR